MSSSSPAPKLPIWIFLATDAVLLVAAAYLADRAPRPLPDSATLGIVACVLAGAIIGLVPLVAYYERQKNETLDQRQRALEALARTLESSAEQISIATAGLHEIAETAQRNLKHAEQLPQRLQEKMAEFQAQLANTSDAEKEELEKEVEELRASETERLQTTFDRISRTAGEFTKLDASIQQHLTAANETVAKLAAGSAAAAAKAQGTTDQVVTHAREQAAKAVGAVTAEAMKEIERAKAAAVRDLSAQFDSNLSRLRDTAQQLGAIVDRLPAGGGTGPAPTVQVSAPVPEPVIAPDISTQGESPGADTSPAAPALADAAPIVAQPAKRSRKPRREEPAGPIAAPQQADAAAPHPAAVANPESDQPAAAAVAELGHEAPVPVAAESAPPTVKPSEPSPADAGSVAATPAHSSADTDRPNGSAAPHADAAATTNGASDPVASLAKPMRKRPARTADDNQPGLGLDLGEVEAADPTAPGTIERVISPDGATRLIVTAYIGIGNRLFIRGSGPGLSWDKGVPLQFVSIGKWRWESNEASTPVQLKLLKNDVQESAGLGALTIDPGHQHEVTATFN